MGAYGGWAGYYLSCLLAEFFCADSPYVFFGFAVYHAISVVPRTEDVLPQALLEALRPLLCLTWPIVGLYAFPVTPLALSPCFREETITHHVPSDGSLLGDCLLNNWCRTAN